MELLAPAGDLPCLEAAIDAGADAVYLGLSLMNARRGARNFTPAELKTACRLARDKDGRLRLPRKIAISRREAGAAAPHQPRPLDLRHCVLPRAAGEVIGRSQIAVAGG
ncbi:MAG: hypothetical protein LIQ31_02340, partial [Planctomycetes bacterium]|nr:hypothetical protein [Planctomycetota bacterium]